MLLPLALLAGALGCRTPGQACLQIRSDVSLNLYDGMAHATDLYLYPLSDSLSFTQMSAEALLEGAKPAGMTQAEPLKITILPGEQRRIEQQFPEATERIGLVADFYRDSGDDPGARVGVVRAICGRRSPPVALSVSRLVLE